MLRLTNMGLGSAAESVMSIMLAAATLFLIELATILSFFFCYKSEGKSSFSV